MDFTDDEAGVRLYINPIDVIEQLGEDQAWILSRSTSDELLAEIEGEKGAYFLHCLWRDDLNSLQVTVSMDVSVPKRKLSSFKVPLSSINERLWIGHFELCAHLGRPLFRYTALLENTGESSGVNCGFVEKIIGISLGECDRFFPIFRLLVEEKNMTQRSSLDLALADPLGTA